MKTNKGFAPIAIILIIIGVLAVGGIAYYVGKSSNTPLQNNNAPVNQDTTTINSPTNNSLSVTPASGKAPLTITASFDGCNPLLTWGDGTKLEGGYGMNTCGGGIPISEHPILSKNHTYTVPGIYTISLFNLDTNSKPISTSTVTVTQPIITNTVNWDSLIPSMRVVLKKTFTDFAVESGGQPISISQKVDVTGDGIPEALVDLGTGAASSDYFAVMRIENNKPVMATFKEKDGTITTSKFFMDGIGGSGRYGSKIEMQSDKNAIYSASYYKYGGSSDSCGVSIYQWNPQTKIFEYNATLSNPAQQDYCKTAGTGLNL